MMTRNEMLRAISQPNMKITHIYFTADEYLYMGTDGNIYDENGYLFEDWYSDGVGRHDGIRSRNGGYWETGWYIFENN